MSNTKLISNYECGLIHGALDSLAVALTEYNHVWTDGERTIYEQALGILIPDGVAGSVLAPQWSKDPPTEQDWYWHWNLDPDCAPLPTSVLFSGTSQKCFVSAGQLGIEEAIDCDAYGGAWIKMKLPEYGHGNLP